MPLPESFKYDVRVRERLSRRGELNESELEKHIEALPDVAANAVDVELKQPALQTEAERAENSVIVRPAAARPVMVAPTPIEDLEDDEEEVEERKPPVRAVGSVRPVAAASAASAADDEEDDDDEDEDEDDADDAEDEETSDKSGGGAAEGASEGEKKEESDDGWGAP